MSQLIKNPYLTLKLKPIGQEIVAVIVEAPVMGRGLQINKVKRQDDPEFFELLFAIQLMLPEKAAQIFPALPEPARKRLWDMAVFLDPKSVSSPVLYSCFLEDEGGGSIKREQRLSKDLIVSPFFHYRPDEELPDSLRHRVRFNDRFLRGFSMAWVENPSSEIIFPYWIPESLRNSLALLKPGEKVPAFSKGTMLALRKAGIVVPKRTIPRDLPRAAGLDDAWREFALRKYTLVEGLIPPLHLKSLQEYFQSLMDFGWVRLGDPDSPLRYNAHNDELVFFFQDQAASLASRIAGRPVKSSHNHLISYLPGATLRKHVDQAEHRYGLSLLLDFRNQPSPSQPGKSWPLVLHAEDGQEGVEIPQEIGEAIFYDACEVPHSRRGALPEGQVSSSLLLHFVPQEDRGPKEYSPFYY